MTDNRKWPPKRSRSAWVCTSIRISLKLEQIALKFERKIWGLSLCKIWQVIAICNCERHPELATWPPKPEIIISLELWQIASKFQQQIRYFRPWWAPQACFQVSATTKENGNGKLKTYIAIFGCRSLSQFASVSPEYTFFELNVVKNPTYAVGISILSVVVLEI